MSQQIAQIGRCDWAEGDTWQYIGVCKTIAPLYKMVVKFMSKPTMYVCPTHPITTKETDAAVNPMMFVKRMRKPDFGEQKRTDAVVSSELCEILQDFA